MINKVQYKEFEFSYQVFNYLYRSIFDFALEHDLDIWTEHKLTIQDEHLQDLIVLCELTMEELLNRHYKKPSVRQVSKNPSRFRNIEVGGKRYKVEYRLSPMGREVVGIKYFSDWLKNHNHSSK